MKCVDLHTIQKIRASVHFTGSGKYGRTARGRRQRPLIHGASVGDRRAAALSFLLLTLASAGSGPVSVVLQCLGSHFVLGSGTLSGWGVAGEAREWNWRLNPGNVDVLKSEVLRKRPPVEDRVLLVVRSLVVGGAGVGRGRREGRLGARGLVLTGLRRTRGLARSAPQHYPRAGPPGAPLDTLGRKRELQENPRIWPHSPSCPLRPRSFPNCPLYSLSSAGSLRNSAPVLIFRVCGSLRVCAKLQHRGRADSELVSKRL